MATEKFPNIDIAIPNPALRLPRWLRALLPKDWKKETLKISLGDKEIRMVITALQKAGVPLDRFLEFYPQGEGV